MIINMPEATVGSRVCYRQKGGENVLLQGWRKHLCSMGSKEISWRNPVELPLSSIYNGLVMNTAIVCRKITQQGKLF